MDYQILFQSPYEIFTIMALFTLGFSLLEIIMVVLGMSFDNILNHINHVDLDADIELPSIGDSSHIEYDGVNLLNIGNVPFLVILLSLSWSFSFFGFGFHYLLQELGLSLSNLFVIPSVIGLSLFFTSVISMIWKRSFSGKDSVAISEKSFIGKVGVVNLGTATNNNPVEISIYDEKGMKHYIMGRVALPNISVEQSNKVYILHKKKDDYFLILPYFAQEDKNKLTKEFNCGV